jgi:hypothetical protein
MENAAPDVTSAQAPPAESSPATTAVPPRDEAGYAEWRLKGTVVEKQPKPKTEAPAPSSESAEGEQPEEKTASDSEPGEKKQEPQRRRDTAADRLQELLGDLKRAGLTPSELKTFKREAQQQAAQQQPPQTSANPPQPKPEPPKELKAPVLDEYKSWEEFRKAELEYNQQSTRQIVQQAMREFLAQQAQAQAQQAANQRLEEAEKRYGPEARSTIASSAQGLFGNERIPDDIKRIVNNSPVIADLLYVMGSNAGELQEFLNLAQTNPDEALRKTVLLEHMVKEELAKNKQPSNGHEAERDESGRFVKNAPAKAAPPPAREVSGKASPPPNDVDAAFQRNDVRAYINAANRRDLAAFKGR